MPWVSRIAAPHRICEKPSVHELVGVAAGSVWRCPTCGKEWSYAGLSKDIYGTSRADWTELPSGASDPASTWSGLLVNLDEDTATGRANAPLTTPRPAESLNAD